jgi:uncharacterized protein YecT (DUF1311 family)
MKRLTALFLFVFPLPAFASPASNMDSAVAVRYSPEHGRCIDAARGGDIAMIDCNDAEVERQDVALNQVYRGLLGRLPSAQAARLRASQRAWLRNGEGYCTKEVGSPFEQWGTLEHLRYSNCYLDRTIRRTVLLERYRDGRASLRDLDR